MTILDYNTINQITDKMVNIPLIGRSGVIQSVTILNKETKEEYIVGFTEPDEGGLQLDLTPFWSSLAVESTLSLIVKGDNLVLFRDIIVFRDSLGTEENYNQYNTDERYFIYGGEESGTSSGNLFINPNFTSLGSNLMTTFTDINERSSHVIGGVDGEFLTISGQQNLDGVTVDGLDNLEAGRMYRISMNLTYLGTDKAYVDAFIGGRNFSYNTSEGSGFTVYLYADDSDLSMSMFLRIGSDAADLIVSQYSIQKLEGWSVSGDNAGSFITPVSNGFSRTTFGLNSRVPLSTLTSDYNLSIGELYTITGNVTDRGAGMDVMQGDTVLGSISSLGDFSLTFTSLSTEGISFKYPNSTDSFRIEDITLRLA